MDRHRCDVGRPVDKGYGPRQAEGSAQGEPLGLDSASGECDQEESQTATEIQVNRGEAGSTTRAEEIG